MSWLQLRLDCDPASAEALEAALLDAGALAITLRDRADEPLLEPGVGETPLWQAIRLTGLFPADADMDAVVGAVRARLPGVASAPRIEILEDRDWSREWMRHYQPMQFGERLWICPSWLEPPQPDAVNLLLDPGLAFGTGTHPTTAMCLSAVDRRVRDGQWVVDYGCGSGVLGVAALRLGAGRLLAIDNDPQALTATRANAERNGIARASLHIGPPDDPAVATWEGRGDLVLANILAGPLAALRDTLCDLLAPGGELVMAGLLDTQAAGLIETYAPRLILTVIDQQQEWVCLAGRRMT
jgi:ribosomal protein L11 methyltransferase